jgi:hypothetical protein
MGAYRGRDRSVLEDFAHRTLHQVSATVSGAEPAAPAGLLDTTLGAARIPDYLLDLHVPAPALAHRTRGETLILPSYAEDNEALRSARFRAGVFVHDAGVPASHRPPAWT